MFDSSIFVKNVGPEKVVRNLSGALYSVFKLGKPLVLNCRTVQII